MGGSAKVPLLLLGMILPFIVTAIFPLFPKDPAPVISQNINPVHEGIVAPLLFTEHGSSSNSSEDLIFSNTNPGRAYLEVPAQWQTNFINVSVSNLLENRSWTNNSGFDLNSDGWSAYDNAKYMAYGNATELWVNHTWPPGQNCTYLRLNGTYLSAEDRYWYSGTLEAGFLEKITIPRGQIFSARLSCDIYPQYATNSPNFEIIYYIYQNNQSQRAIIASEDFRQTSARRHQWNARSFLLDPSLFDITLNNTIMFGFGLVVGRDNPTQRYGYSSTIIDAKEQIIYFDNVQLQLQARSKPSDVNLTLSTCNQIYNVSDINWSLGNATLRFPFPEIKDINPTLLELQFLSNWSDCSLDWVINANGSTTSEVVWEPMGALRGMHFTAQQGDYISWDFYLYARIPVRWTTSYYICMNLTSDWTISRVLDPYFVDRTGDIQGGELGSGWLEIPSSIANIFGFWKVEVQSPNYNITECGICETNFQPNKVYLVNSIVNFSINMTQETGLPCNLDNSIANITMHHPNGSIFYQSNSIPDSNGIVQYSPIEIGGSNTSLGAYNVEFLWTNGTEVGFWNPSFIIQHQSELRLTIPSNYVSGQKIETLYGSSVALRVELCDVDADRLVGGAQVWLSNAKIGNPLLFNEMGDGIYDITLDSNLFSEAGVYSCTVSVSGIGVVAQDLIINVSFFVPQTMEWIIIALIAVLVVGISGSLIRSKLILPRRTRAYNQMMETTSYYYDAHNLVGYLILYKEDGIAIFDQWQDVTEKRVDANLISGFLTAITAFGDQLPVVNGFHDARIKKSQKNENSEKLRMMSMDYQDFVILLLDGHVTRLAAIFSERPSIYFEARMRRFMEDFEEIYHEHVQSFNRTLDTFQNVDRVFNKHIHFQITRPVELSLSTKAKKAQKNIELTNEEERMINVIKSFLRERDYVHLRTVASLYATNTKDEELNAVKGIVGLWLKGMLAPVDPEESIETALRFFSQEDAEILSVIANGTLNHDLIASELKLSRNAVDAKLQSFRAWKLINLKDSITEKGRVLLERRLAMMYEKKEIEITSHYLPQT